MDHSTHLISADHYYDLVHCGAPDTLYPIILYFVNGVVVAYTAMLAFQVRNSNNLNNPNVNTYQNSPNNPDVAGRFR